MFLLFNSCEEHWEENVVSNNILRVLTPSAILSFKDELKIELFFRLLFIFYRKKFVKDIYQIKNNIYFLVKL